MVRDQIFRIQMLGGFAMRYGDKAVTMNKMGSSKAVRLLQMLFLSYPHKISKSELIDNLYGWDEKTDAANRNKNLNNLIYRLRKQLVSCGLPDREYVELHDGMCSFQCDIPLEVDAHRFQEAVEAARGCAGGVKRVERFQAANEMYRGELLPANQTETWFLYKSNYYKKLYVYTIEELEETYRQNNDYKNRLSLYARAAAIYPFDNWQIRLIRCNLEIYRYDDALDIYNSTLELYAREMGTPPAAEMKACFEEIKQRDDNCRNSTGGVGSWKSMDKVFIGKKTEIREVIFGGDKRKGAYYCTYPSFVDYCRLIARAMGRNKFEAVLMFLTLTQRGGKENQKQMYLPEQMQLLKEAIGSSLRVGDAYTRYGNRHFILMLVEIEQKCCSSVFQRIESAYMGKSGKGELWYYADMTQELRI